MGKKVNLSIAFLIVLFLALSTQAAAISSRESWPEPEIGEQSEAPAVLEPGKDYVADEVIVALKKGASKSKIKSVNAKFQTKTKSEIPQIGAYVLEVPKGKSAVGLKKSLKKIKDLRYAELNYKVEPSLEPNDPLWSTSGSWGQSFDDLWGLKRIEADEAWEGSTGSSSVVVGVVDTGLDDAHEDIQANVWNNPGESGGGKESNGIDDDGNGYIDDLHGWDFYSDDSDPEDNHGHGTHVSGTIGAVGNNGAGVVGVNWNVKIMALKFMDVGGGWAEDAAEAVIYGADNGAAITNHSWGPRDPVEPYFIPEYLKDAIAYATSKGSTTVAAAGNSSTDVSTAYPANDANVIAVSATDHLDNLASFSNRGADIDVAAPGVAILSLKAGGAFAWGPIVSSDYFVSNGTSMASPHVAGLAALVLSANPNVTNEEVRQILRDTAEDIGSPGKDDLYGYGLINAKNAFDHPLVGWLSKKQPYPGSFISDATPRISATLSQQTDPDTATVQLRVDGVVKTHSYEASTNEIYYQVESPLSQGPHTVDISLQDISGVPINDSWSFTVDTVAPSAPTDLVATLQTASIDLSWTGSIDASSGEQFEIERSVDGIDFAIIGTSELPSFSDTELLGGTTQYFYRVRSIDKARNASTYSNVVQVAVEDTPPVTVANLTATAGDNGWYTSRVIVELVSSDSGSGVSETKYRINGGDWSTYASEFDIASEGENTLEYYGMDNYSNTEAPKTEIIKMDSSAPEGDVFINDGSSYTNTQDVTLDFSSITDSASGLDKMMISEDAAFAGGNWQDFEASAPFTLSAGDGEKTVYVKFKDIAGNTDANSNSYSDDLSTATYNDASHTTAVWNTAAGEIRLPSYTGIWLEHPAWDLQASYRALTPALADLDDDGDHDVLVKNGAYKNIGNSSYPVWVAEPNWGVGSVETIYPAPALADLDGDGDFDVLMGGYNGTIYAYENAGGPISPVWTRKVSWDVRSSGSYAMPSLADLDGDGDTDILVGHFGGTIQAFKNTGDSTSPLWSRESSWDGPEISRFAAPALADLDNDGDYDLISGSRAGQNQTYKNTGDVTAPIWTRETSWDAPVVGSCCEYDSHPAFADLDGDNDADLLIGVDYRISVFENTSDSPTVFERSAVAQSRTLDTTDEVIDKATLDATEILNGQTIDYQLSRDGGLTWEDVSKGVEHTFVSSFSPSNSDLRWRAILGTAKSSITPVLTAVGVKYNEQYSGKQAQVILDTEVPSSPTALVGFLSGAQVNLSWLLSVDTLSGVKDYEIERSADGASFVNIGSATETGFTDSLAGGGTYYYRVRAEDNALNVSGYSNVVEIELLPDNTAPVTQASLDGTVGDNGWYQSVATVELTAVDSGSGVKETKYRIDGASWITYTSEFLISLEGESTLEYYSEDNFGNTEAAKSETVKVDRSAPVGSLLINNDQTYTNSKDVTLDVSSASDNISGLSKVMISEDENFIGSVWQDYQPSMAFTMSNGDGLKTVYVKFKDLAGNSEMTTFSDAFTTAVYRDTSNSTAFWDIATGEIRLPLTDGIWLRQNDWDAPNVGVDSEPALADLDNDGDLDLLIGEELGSCLAYKNIGDQTAPVWAREPGWDVPDVGAIVSPAFGDLDNDNDFDLLVGVYVVGPFDGMHVYAFENTGNSSSPIWTRQESWRPPGLSHFSQTIPPWPSLADLDGDGDPELLIGTDWTYDQVYFYRNTGDGTSPVWTREAFQRGAPGRPSFGDLDNDGDFDYLQGGVAYKNTGTPYDPIWKSEPAWNPIGIRPALARLDDDDYPDLLVGSSDGSVSAYQSHLTDYQSLGIAQSSTIDTTDEIIRKATIDATEVLNGQTIDYQLSRDGGLNWEDVANGVEHSFASNSLEESDLRWKATLRGSAEVSPAIKDVSVAYTTAMVVSDNIYLDQTAPLDPSALIANVSGAQVSMTWLPSDDALSGLKDYEIERSTDGISFARKGISSTTSYVDNPVASGTYYYRVRARDYALNVSGYTNVVQVELAPDSIAPVTQASLDGVLSENGWHRSAVTVELSSSDSGSGVWRTKYRINGASWITYTSAVLISTEDENTLQYYAIDNFRNVEATKTEIIKIDTSAPVGTVAINNDDLYTSSKDVNLDLSSANDGVSGLAKVMVSEDVDFAGAVWQDYQASLPLTLSDGDDEKTVYVKLKDTAGNANTDSFTEDFTSTTRREGYGATTASWDTSKGEVSLPRAEIWVAKPEWDAPGWVPALADMDNDGDLDLLSGDFDGGLLAYRNTGSDSSPLWVRETAWDGPVGAGYLRPDLVDLDSDGDPDLLIGRWDGRSVAYRNTGDRTAPIWTREVGWDPPAVPRSAAPEMADLDNDGDFDLLIGADNDPLVAYENAGGPASPVWIRKPGWDVPMSRPIVAPALGDIDNDSDLDLLVGEMWQMSEGYRNVGNEDYPIWSREPLWFVDYSKSFHHPELEDLDLDGDSDLVLGSSFRTIGFENTGGGAYAAQAAAQSKTVDSTNEDIIGATLVAMEIPNGQTVSYELSRDGATSWESVENGIEHAFVSTEAEQSDLRWRATLSGDGSSTPIILSIRIDYRTAIAFDTIILDTGPPQLPLIESSTHPDPAEWYANNDPLFSWAEPADPSGIEGYSYVLDQSPATIPDETIETSDTSASFSDVSEGTSYFHVRAKDNAGQWGEAGHFQINIAADSTAPSIPQNVAITPTDVDSAMLSWDASTDTGGSGLAGYRVYDTKTGAEVADVATTSHTLTSLVAGDHSYFVKAFDGAGNASARSRFAAIRLPVRFAWQSVDIFGKTFAANPAGATATASFIFEGEGVSINYGCGLNTGIFEVSIDGAVVDTVDAYCSPHDFNAQVTYPTSPGGHILTVRPTGTKNPSSNYFWTLLYSFEVAGEIYEEDDGIIYTWQTVDILGSTFSANPAGSTPYMSFTYFGDEATIHYACGLNTGLFEVWIDGRRVDGIDPYRSVPDFSCQKTYPTPPLDTHTITIIPTGSKNPSSSYFWVLIDSFETGGSVYQAQALPRSEAESLEIPEGRLSKLLQRLPEPVRERIEKRLEKAGGIASADTISLLNSEKLTRLVERLEDTRDSE